MRPVLILSYEEDPHASAVCSFFSKTGVDFFRVDTDKLIGNYYLTFDSRRGAYRIENAERSEIIDSDWTIWNRRVMDPDMPPDIPKDLQDIVYTETKRTWDGLLFSHKGRILNAPQANYAANNKIDQLLFAKEYGIAIPETILTNDPKKLLEFYATNEKICHKLQKAALVERDGGHLITYNNIVKPEDMQHAALIERSPSLFQRYIEKDYEVRVTGIGEKVIGIAIHSQDSEQSKIDYRRYDFENVRYEKVDLPEKVTSFCTAMMKRYNLGFGEFDIIKNKNGEHVFLELNPNGQWLWLELKSRYPLSQDIAEYLCKD